MKHRLITAALTACVLLLGSQVTFAVDTKAATSPPAVSKVKAKPATKIKLVDINSASAAELKKLPGIGDAEVAKIIAGRPYGSKAWLVTHQILAEDKYPAVKDLVIAKQAGKDATKNAALYRNKK